MVRIDAELIEQEVYDQTFGSLVNWYKCPCGQGCIAVDIEMTPGRNGREAKIMGKCRERFVKIVEDYNSFILYEEADLKKA